MNNQSVFFTALWSLAEICRGWAQCRGQISPWSPKINIKRSSRLSKTFQCWNKLSTSCDLIEKSDSTSKPLCPVIQWGEATNSNQPPLFAPEPTANKEVGISGFHGNRRAWLTDLRVAFGIFNQVAVCCDWLPTFPLLFGDIAVWLLGFSPIKEGSSN